MRKEFNKYLPLEKRMILPENQDGDENGNYQRSSIKLYKCSENNGKYRVAEVGVGPFQPTDLNPDVSRRNLLYIFITNDYLHVLI